MSKLDKDQVIARFTAAYEAANGKTPVIEAKGGWYTVDGGKNMRLAQLEELAQSLGSTDTTPAPSKAKATKPAAATSKKTKAAKATGFSVKAFWNSQLQAGSIQPR